MVEDKCDKLRTSLRDAAVDSAMEVVIWAKTDASLLTESILVFANVELPFKIITYAQHFCFAVKREKKAEKSVNIRPFKWFRDSKCVTKLENYPSNDV